MPLWLAALTLVLCVGVGLGGFGLSLEAVAVVAAGALGLALAGLVSDAVLRFALHALPPGFVLQRVHAHGEWLHFVDAKDRVLLRCRRSQVAHVAHQGLRLHVHLRGGDVEQVMSFGPSAAVAAAVEDLRTRVRYPPPGPPGV